MDKQQSNLHFRFMSFGFRFRDFFQPRKKVLAEVNIEPGFNVLDYGCGPGSYTTVAAKLVGETGMVYALDIHPLAVKQVQKMAAKRNLSNIETILSDCATGLPDASIDLALLFDTFHELEKPQAVLAELHRVLKPDSVLSFNDHHLKEEREIILGVTGGGLFRIANSGNGVYTFTKVG